MSDKRRSERRSCAFLSEPTTGDQRQNQVVRAQSLYHFQHTFGRLVAVFVGNGVSRFDDLYLIASNGVAVSGHD